MFFLRTFGGLTLEDPHGRRVSEGLQTSRLAILAVLAASVTTGLSRDGVMALFWPDSDIERARGALKQSLYAIRKQLDQDLIIGGSQLTLNRSVIESDVIAFDDAIRASQWDSAVDLYAGPFLYAVHVKAAAEFERWADQERERRASMYVSALEKLSADAGSAQDFAKAAEFRRRLFEFDSANSKRARNYIEALIAAGDRDTALRVFRRHQDAVRNDLGCEPAAEIAELVASIIRLPLPVRKNGAGQSQDLRVEGRPRGKPLDESGTTSPRVSQVRRRGTTQWVLGITGLAAAAFVAATALKGTATTSVRPTIMVPAFTNESSDSTLTPVGNMAADWILQGISAVSAASVIDPATAASALRNLRKNGAPAPSPIDFAKETGATDIVLGAFYTRGDSLEFHARVAHNDGRVRAVMEPVVVPRSRSGEAIRLVRQRVLGILARQFDLAYGDLVATQGSPPLFASYQEYERGVKLFTDDDTGASIAHFRKAYEIDTTFVTALVWAVHGYVDVGNYDSAKVLIKSLMQRRDRLVPLDRYAVQAFNADFDGNEPAKIEFAEEASKVAPASQWTWISGWYLVNANRPHEALKYFAMIDPTRNWMEGPRWQANYWAMVSTAQHMVGNDSAALAATLKAKTVAPDWTKIEGILARDYGLAGDRSRMWQSIARIESVDKQYGMEALWRTILDFTRHGKGELAREAADTAFRFYNSLQSPTEDDIRPHAEIQFALGKRDDARRETEALVKRFPKSEWMSQYKGTLALLAAMRGDSVTARSISRTLPPVEVWPGEHEYWRARVEAQLGNKSVAVQLLKTALAKGYGAMWVWHSRRPDFPTLYGYAPFEKLVSGDRDFAAASKSDNLR